MQRADSLEKILMLGKVEGKRRGWQRMRWLDSITNSMDMNLSKLWWLSGKESACNTGDLGSIPGLGRYPGEGNGNPLQYSCLENRMDRRAWLAAVHGVAKSWTRLSNFTSLPFYSNGSKVGLLDTIRMCAEPVLLLSVHRYSPDKASLVLKEVKP